MKSDMVEFYVNNEFWKLKEELEYCLLQIFCKPNKCQGLLFTVFLQCLTSGLPVKCLYMKNN